MKTLIVLEIDHKKPLPTKSPITDIVAQRVYGYLYSQGCEAGVQARVEVEVKEQE
jgi:hypothetical protein